MDAAPPRGGSVVALLARRRENPSMSLRNHARQATRQLAKTIYVNYGRFLQYSAVIDRVNRRPLLHRFAQTNATVPSFPSREEMWSFIARRRSVAVDYLEFGVHRGHSILYFASQNRAPESRFYGFDSFAGLPEDWNDRYRRGHFDTGGRIPETTDPRVKFVVGYFHETLPGFLSRFVADKPVIVNIDCDLYSSALYCLTRLDASLPKGTIIIFDEFGDVLHEFRAANDYASSYRRDYRVICSHDNFYTVAIELL
jgi:O-methyltransferase